MNLDGNARREAIVKYLSSKTSPVSGTELAKHFGVSRQIIVQDIALLRAENRNILSTNKGYVLFHPQEKRIGCTAVPGARSIRCVEPQSCAGVRFRYLPKE